MTTSDESWLEPIFDAVVSDVQRTGYFTKVNTHEAKRKPAGGLSAAVWVDGIAPIALASGQASTSARVVFRVRVYSNMLQEPQDMIDPNMMRAVSNIMREYHGDFDFGNTVRNVDLLGYFGVSLEAISGYLEIDGTMYRIMDITVPVIVNDVWPQITEP